MTKQIKDDFKFLVESAIKAPSGHNTQPWKFEQIDNRIIINPDFNRSLPVVDNDNHELYISLGCALENLLIAAKQKGYVCKVQYPEKSGSSINVELNKDDSGKVETDILFDEIFKRQVTKSKYNNKHLPADVLKQLSSCFNFKGISLLILDGKRNFEKIIPTIIEANNFQFKNREFLNELVCWIRFSNNEAEKKKDGIWSATMGMPGLGRFLGSVVMKFFVTAKSEEKRLVDLLEHTQGLAIFISDTNNAEVWVKTGQSFQRFGLTATHLGVSHAHLNMPCEEIEVRHKLVKKLNLENKHPLLLIRYEYAEKMPYSYRRKFSDVIIPPPEVIKKVEPIKSVKNEIHP